MMINHQTQYSMLNSVCIYSVYAYTLFSITFLIFMMITALVGPKFYLGRMTLGVASDWSSLIG